MILFLLFFILFVFAIQYIAKLLLATMKRNENPYIRFHKLKMKNEMYYQDYLRWLQKKDSSGVPIEKAQSIEDYNASEKIKRLLK